MEEKLAGLKHGIKWSTLNAFSLVVSKILRGVAVPKLLLPASYGLFTSVGIFTRYLQFSDFGSSAYFVKEIPHVHFNQDARAKQEFLDRTFTQIVLSFAVVTVYLGSAAFLYNGREAGFYRTALVLLIPIMILSKLKEFLLNYSLGTQNYRQSTIASMVNNYVSLALVVAGVYLYGALGGVVGMLLSESAVFIYVYREVRIKVGFSVSVRIFSSWKQNLKQFSVSIVELIAATVDQLFILKVFDVASLGFYALGLTFSWLFESLSEIFNTAAYPKVMTITKRDRASAETLLEQTVLCYLLAGIFVLPVAVYFMEAIVTYYFSQYSAGLKVYALMLSLGIFRGLSSLLRRGFIALDKEKKYVAYNLGIIAAYSLALAAAWLLALPFEKVIVLIVLVNLMAFILLYQAMIERKTGIFWKNLGYTLLAVLFLFLYQYLARSEFFVFLRPDAGLFLICGAIVFFLLLAYRERVLVAKYLE